MTLKREQIVDQVHKLQVLVEAWDNQALDAQGSPPPLFDSPVMLGIRQLAAATRTMDIEPSAWELVLALDAFLFETEQWLQRYMTDVQVYTKPSGINAPLEGAGEMWTAWVVVRKLLPARRRNLPLPVQVLIEQRVPTNQICRMYGWTLDGGRPDTTKLAEHIAYERRGEASPHFDPVTWTAPADRQAAAKVAEKWRGRPERLSRMNLVSLDGDERLIHPRPEHRIPAEPIEFTALLRGMTPKQLARMYELTEDEVRTELAAKGIVLVGQEFREATLNPGVRKPGLDWQLEQQVQATARQLDAEAEEWLAQYQPTIDSAGDDLADQVLALSADSVPPQKIAKVLTAVRAKSGQGKVTYQQVNKMLAKAEKTAAA